MKKFIFYFLLLFISINASAKKSSGIYYFEYKLGTTTLDGIEGIDVSMNTYTTELQVFSGANARNFYVEFTLKNKSTKIVYVDLGNSFFIRNEEPLCYYVPTSSTVTQGQSVGGGVNVGAIAGAIGVNGAVGTALNGVNVGGEKSSSQSTTVYNQRVIAIPPLSKISLAKVPMFTEGSEAYTDLFYVKKYNWRGLASETGDLYAFVNKDYGVGLWEEGEMKDYSEETSPVKFTLFLTTSFNESINEPKQGNACFYVNKIIASKRNFKGMISGKQMSSSFMDEVYPGWQEKSYFTIERNR